MLGVNDSTTKSSVLDAVEQGEEEDLEQVYRRLTRLADRQYMEAAEAGEALERTLAQIAQIEEILFPHREPEEEVFHAAPAPRRETGGPSPLLRLMGGIERMSRQPNTLAGTLAASMLLLILQVMPIVNYVG